MVNFKPVLLFLKIISLFIVQRNFDDILQGNGIDIHRSFQAIGRGDFIIDRQYANFSFY